jgi:hypothetical protein
MSATIRLFQSRPSIKPPPATFHSLLSKAGDNGIELVQPRTYCTDLTLYPYPEIWKGIEISTKLESSMFLRFNSHRRWNIT